MNRALNFLLVALLVLLLIGLIPAWPYSAGWGYYPAGGVGLLLIVLLLVLFLGTPKGRDA
ncbi:MAG TPA: DUF3309 family protein [Phycisphaerales bacterium]|nr:DUF3309 family protein [Phycisphaerales bacterium]